VAIDIYFILDVYVGGMQGCFKTTLGGTPGAVKGRLHRQFGLAILLSDVILK
jgi:hypothetical protein